MTWWLWIVAGIGLVVVGNVVLVLTGIFVPRIVSGTALFAKEIRRYEIDPAKLDPSFVSAAVSQCERISVAGKYMPGHSQVTYFHELVVRAAQNVAFVIKGQRVSEDDPVVKLARAHNVRERYVS